MSSQFKTFKTFKTKTIREKKMYSKCRCNRGMDENQYYNNVITNRLIHHWLIILDTMAKTVPFLGFFFFVCLFGLEI